MKYIHYIAVVVLAGCAEEQLNPDYTEPPVVNQQTNEPHDGIWSPEALKELVSSSSIDHYTDQDPFTFRAYYYRDMSFGDDLQAYLTFESLVYSLDNDNQNFIYVQFKPNQLEAFNNLESGREITVQGNKVSVDANSLNPYGVMFRGCVLLETAATP